ncbi:winged helix-turn-helix domain-containing protein, partial [Aurantimonas sp. A2-1-M11]|uniref:helix-turn-helix domain-containing protein n=1 Tax=Aurantimonas sp. A2-1-M11 TaxID=3113712 RepID=UPI002F93529A
TLAELSRWIEARFDKRVHPASLSRILRRNGFSRQKARSTHPQSDPGRQARFKKKGSPRP